MNLKEQLTHPVFGLIEKAADRHRLPVYVVGGFVRDLLLERPSADVDCVVLGDGIGLCREL